MIGEGPASAIEHGERALALAARLDLPPPARAWEGLGMAKLALGDRSGEADLRRAVARALEDGNASQAVIALHDLGISLIDQVGLEAAFEMYGEVVALEASLGGTGIAGFGRVIFLSALGRWDEGLDAAQAWYRSALDRGDLWQAAVVGRRRAAMLLERGEGVSLIDQELVPSLTGELQLDRWLAGLRAWLALERGSAAGAIPAEPTTGSGVLDLAITQGLLRGGALQAADAYVHGGAPVGRADVAAHTAATAALAEYSGETSAARGGYLEAAVVLRELVARWALAHTLTGLGRCQVALGETDEAVAALTESRELWVGMKATPRIAEIDELLATVRT
jgi:tetratricopeptide (TPR) repeat protein